MQATLDSIRTSVDQADTALKAVQANLVNELSVHADALGSAAQAKATSIFKKPVPLYHLGTAGGLGALVPVIVKFFM